MLLHKNSTKCIVRKIHIYMFNIIGSRILHLTPPATFFSHYDTSNVFVNYLSLIMTRDELLQQIKICEELITPERRNRPGNPIMASKITIHNTSNRNARADAIMQSHFLQDTGYYTLKDLQSGEVKKQWVSWHFTVDDKIAIRHLPPNEMACHASTAANKSSISIEICMYEGINQEKANEKAAQLVALLCFDHAIPLEGIVPHKFWTGKNCPELLLSNWKAFVDKSAFYLKNLSHSTVLKNVNLESDLLTESFEIPLCWTQFLDQPFRYDFPHSGQLLAVSVQDGFNDSFLRSGKVRLPILKNQEDYVFIHHQNMTIYFNKSRKLALYSSCNFDKDSLFEPMTRSDSFRDDPLLDFAFQLGKGFYSSATLDSSQSRNFFDRGHLIARRYNQWGPSEEVARLGERDTYFFTTIHPQVKELNQDEWEKLESFIIESGKLDVRRVSIIAGALLKTDDPVATYEDAYYKVEKAIKIPIVYWKVVYYEVDQELRRIGFLMSQRNRLQEMDFVKFEDRAMVADDPFDKIGDPIKTFIIPCELIETTTGLAFTSAVELYDKMEPLEVVIEDNETHQAKFGMTPLNILKYI